MCQDDLSSLVRDYLEIDQEIKSKQLIEAQIRDEIKQEMESLEVEELVVGEHIVRYKNLLTSSFNLTLFKEKYPELFTAFLRQIQSKKFSIS